LPYWGIEIKNPSLTKSRQDAPAYVMGIRTQRAGFPMGRVFGKDVQLGLGPSAIKAGIEGAEGRQFCSGKTVTLSLKKEGVAKIWLHGEIKARKHLTRGFAAVAELFWPGVDRSVGRSIYYPFGETCMGGGREGPASSKTPAPAEGGGVKKGGINRLGSTFRGGS